MNRRKFTFWVTFGLFSLAERLNVYGFDELAAALLRRAEPSQLPTHWRAASNAAWRWYERETFIDGQWQLSGITTPINTKTGDPIEQTAGYLDESLAPPEIREGAATVVFELDPELVDEFEHRRPTPKRQARHGRPPSKWLRNLQADELRIWLRTVEVPQADVSGMTYWTHLTRDHSFDPLNLEGLTIDEQAKLHGAAHFGY